MPETRRVSLNKSQDTVASCWMYLYILKYDAQNHEPKISCIFSVISVESDSSVQVFLRDCMCSAFCWLLCLISCVGMCINFPMHYPMLRLFYNTAARTAIKAILIWHKWRVGGGGWCSHISFWCLACKILHTKFKVSTGNGLWWELVCYFAWK
jgi:hypothetical protein